jgi:DNA-binding NarL/FixJ family response regulator
MASGSKERTVLVVDDAADLRMLLRFALGSSPLLKVVDEAADASTAIDLAGRHQPDVIVLDEMMPGGNGSEAIPELRSVAPGTSIVVYSAIAARLVGEAKAPYRADRYVDKGVPMDELVQAVIEVTGSER